MKQYEVEVMGRYSHGIYGKEHYFGMIVTVNSCKQAEEFAEDILFEMTYEEFFERCIKDCYRVKHVQESFMSGWKHFTNENGEMKCKYFKRKLSDTIGDDHKFTFKARVFKG